MRTQRLLLLDRSHPPRTGRTLPGHHLPDPGDLEQLLLVGDEAGIGLVALGPPVGDFTQFGLLGLADLLVPAPSGLGLSLGHPRLVLGLGLQQAFPRHLHPLRRGGGIEDLGELGPGQGLVQLGGLEPDRLPCFV